MIRLRFDAPDRWEPRSGTTSRISFAWHDDEGPVFAATPSGAPATIVAVWPTDARGYVDAEALPRGPQVLRWELTPALFTEIGEWARQWPLDACDFLVTRTSSGWSLCPRLTHLRSIEGVPTALVERVAATLAQTEVA